MICSSKSKCSRSPCVFFAAAREAKLLHRPECLDQWHANEEVAWLAFEAGNYISNEGLEFQVGNLPVQGGAW